MSAILSGHYKPRARVSAIEVALDDFPDNRTEIPILLLEAPLVIPQEALKIMEQHPVEDRALRMASAIETSPVLFPALDLEVGEGLLGERLHEPPGEPHVGE
jgi:hypothetical protein